MNWYLHCSHWSLSRCSISSSRIYPWWRIPQLWVSELRSAKHTKCSMFQIFFSWRILVCLRSSEAFWKVGLIELSGLGVSHILYTLKKGMENTVEHHLHELGYLTALLCVYLQQTDLGWEAETYSHFLNLRPLTFFFTLKNLLYAPCIFKCFIQYSVNYNVSNCLLR